jgi:hypothetical protein
MTPHLSKIKRKPALAFRQKEKVDSGICTKRGVMHPLHFVKNLSFHYLKINSYRKKSTNSKDVNVDKLAQMWSIISVPRNQVCCSASMKINLKVHACASENQTRCVCIS